MERVRSSGTGQDADRTPRCSVYQGETPSFPRPTSAGFRPDRVGAGIRLPSFPRAHAGASGDFAIIFAWSPRPWSPSRLRHCHQSPSASTTATARSSSAPSRPPTSGPPRRRCYGARPSTPDCATTTPAATRNYAPPAPSLDRLREAIARWGRARDVEARALSDLEALAELRHPP